MVNRFRIYGREEKCVDGDLCYYEDVEAILSSAQLLKAEIAVCANDLECLLDSLDSVKGKNIINKLRQLSAVQ